MYKNMTYEALLRRMANTALEQNPNLDTREGSVLWYSHAPAAVELASLYVQMDYILKQTFGDTADRPFLIRRAAERGLTPYPASPAVVKGAFTPPETDVPEGARFSCGALNYVITGKIADGVYKLECETPGARGNDYTGQLIPIEYIPDLASAKLTQILIPGEDEEDTETFRKRYLESFDTKAYGGNIEDYRQKTNAIPGVGATKVTPVWQGGGTVKLTILDAQFNAATNVLVDKVQQLIDPTKDGQGLGIAPIDHIVTVDTAEAVPVQVEASILFKAGYTFGQMESVIRKAVEEYLHELRSEWEKNTLTVRISQIEYRILSLEYVEDVTGTRLNGTDSNLRLTAYQIPVLGGVVNVTGG